MSEYTKMDQDSVFMFINKLLIHENRDKIKTVPQFNHQSLQAEHGIKP